MRGVGHAMRLLRDLTGEGEDILNCATWLGEVEEGFVYGTDTGRTVHVMFRGGGGEDDVMDTN
jgi:hypothetical protein